MDETRTIVCISGASSIGGAERSLMENVGELRRRGYTCALIAPEGAAIATWAQAEGMRTYAFNFEMISSISKLRLLKKAYAFRSLCARISRETGARFFYSNARLAFTYLVFLQRRFKTFAHHRDARTNELELTLYKWVTANIYITEYTFDRANRPSNGHVVLNAGAHLCNEPPVRPDASLFKLAMFARIDEHKGHHLALEAVERLRETGVNCRLDIWGEPFGQRGQRILDDLKKTVADRGLNVSFKGFHHTPTAAMRDYDCLLSPSFNEPFGRVPVEGFSMGVPVIGHASGGAVEIFRGGPEWEPFLFHEYDSASLAEAIRTVHALAEDADAFAQRIGKMQKDAQRKFHHSRVVDELETLFAQYDVFPSRRT